MIILRRTYHDTVINGEKGKLVKSCNQIPTRSDVSSNEDRDSEDGERVHETQLRRSVIAMQVERRRISLYLRLLWKIDQLLC